MRTFANMRGQTPAATEVCPEWAGYRPARVRISSAVARIVGATAPKATHQILAFCFADMLGIHLTSSHSRTAYRIAAILPTGGGVPILASSAPLARGYSSGCG